MRHAITACAVMAFSLVGTIARGADTEAPNTLTWGETEPCNPDEFDPKMAPSNGSEKLLAAYSESGNVTLWVRLLQRRNEFFVETVVKDGMRRVKHFPPRRHRIDPELARQISAGLAADLARNAFMQTTDEIQVDGIWYLFTVDGKSCASVPMIARTDNLDTWTRAFAELYENSGRRDANAWFLLEQAAHVPATLPTSLAGMTREQAVIGAASTWRHRDPAPIAILNHRAIADSREDGIEIRGELANNMGTARKYVEVLATYFDAGGKELLTESEFVDFSPLPPATRSPFSFLSTVKNAASYTLRVNPGDAADMRPPSVRITSHQEQRNKDEDYEELVVSGTARNEGNTDERFIEIYLLVYDETGRLLDTDWNYLVDPLVAGASAPFELSVELPRAYHHYELVVNPEYRERDRY